MAISKEITQDATGVVVAYHIVQTVTLDKGGKTTTASVMSYVSAEAKAAGKQMVGMPTHITVAGLPSDKENAFSFVEKQLVAPQPADADTTNPVFGFAAARYTFADGKVVADI
jgi:hypothetical protein